MVQSVLDKSLGDEFSPHSFKPSTQVETVYMKKGVREEEEEEDGGSMYVCSREGQKKQ